MTDMWMGSGRMQRQTKPVNCDNAPFLPPPTIPNQAAMQHIGMDYNVAPTPTIMRGPNMAVGANLMTDPTMMLSSNLTMDSNFGQSNFHKAASSNVTALTPHSSVLEMSSSLGAYSSVGPTGPYVDIMMPFNTPLDPAQTMGLYNRATPGPMAGVPSSYLLNAPNYSTKEPPIVFDPQSTTSTNASQCIAAPTPPLAPKFNHMMLPATRPLQPVCEPKAARILNGDQNRSNVGSKTTTKGTQQHAILMLPPHQSDHDSLSTGQSLRAVLETGAPVRLTEDNESEKIHTNYNKGPGPTMFLNAQHAMAAAAGELKRQAFLASGLKPMVAIDDYPHGDESAQRRLVAQLVRAVRYIPREVGTGRKRNGNAKTVVERARDMHPAMVEMKCWELLMRIRDAHWCRPPIEGLMLTPFVLHDHGDDDIGDDNDNDNSGTDAAMPPSAARCVRRSHQTGRLNYTRFHSFSARFHAVRVALATEKNVWKQLTDESFATRFVMDPHGELARKATNAASNRRARTLHVRNNAHVRGRTAGNARVGAMENEEGHGHSEEGEHEDIVSMPPVPTLPPSPTTTANSTAARKPAMPDAIHDIFNIANYCSSSSSSSGSDTSTTGSLGINTDYSKQLASMPLPRPAFQLTLPTTPPQLPALASPRSVSPTPAPKLAQAVEPAASSDDVLNTGDFFSLDDSDEPQRPQDALLAWFAMSEAQHDKWAEEEDSGRARR